MNHTQRYGTADSQDQYGRAVLLQSCVYHAEQDSYRGAKVGYTLD